MVWFFANKYFMEISFISTNIYLFVSSKKIKNCFHFIILFINKKFERFINKIDQKKTKK